MAMLVVFASTAGLLPHHHDGETVSVCLGIVTGAPLEHASGGHSFHCGDCDTPSHRSAHGCCHVIKTSAAVTGIQMRYACDPVIAFRDTELPQTAVTDLFLSVGSRIVADVIGRYCPSNGLRAPPAV